jgi:uncharacterized membrane protein YgcG
MLTLYNNRIDIRRLDSTSNSALYLNKIRKFVTVAQTTITMENGMDYDDSKAEPPARLPGKRRERKGSLAFISDNLPSMPNMPSMPQIPAMLMPTMPANFKMPANFPGFGGAQQKTQDEESGNSSSDDSSSRSGSHSSSSKSDSSSSGGEDRSESAESSSKGSVSRASARLSNKEKGIAAVESSQPSTGDRQSALEDEDDDTTSTADEESLNDSKPKVAAGHTKTVGRLRKVVVLMIVFAATFISIYGRKIMVGQKNSDLEAMVTESASVVFNQAKNNLDLKVSSTIVLSDDVTKLIVSSAWPEVSIPQYESRASVLRLTTNTESVTFLPVVTSATRQDWQTYSQIEFGNWFNESITFLGKRSLTNNPTITPYIFGQTGTAEIGPGPYLPIWQISPPNQNVSGYNYNLDLYSQKISEPIRRVVTEKKVSIQEVLDIDTDLLIRYALELHKLNKNDLYSAFYTPIFDKPGKSRTVSAMLMTVHGWKSLFGSKNNSLFAGSTMDPDAELDCVVKVPNEDMYTIRITADSVTIIGKGELHDRKYDEYAAVFILESAEVSGSYAMTFYPTEAMASNVPSNKPTIYTLIVVLLFLLVLCVFCTFNFAVEKRHRVVMRKLKQASSALINQPLFTTKNTIELVGKEKEETVDMERAPLRPESSAKTSSAGSVSSASQRSSSSKRSASSRRSSSSHRSASSNRSSSLRQEESLLGSINNDSPNSDDEGSLNGHTIHSNATNSMIKEPPKAQMKQILRDESNSKEEKSQPVPGLTIPETKPIADFFPSCTVLFADIIGFNAWSSSRDPIQVFTLLQSVYEVFDKAAKDWGAFKVETIGDSYVGKYFYMIPVNM